MVAEYPGTRTRIRIPPGKPRTQGIRPPGYPGTGYPGTVPGYQLVCVCVCVCVVRVAVRVKNKEEEILSGTS